MSLEQENAELRAALATLRGRVTELRDWHVNQAEVWTLAGSPEHAATHHAVITSMDALGLTEDQ